METVEQYLKETRERIYKMDFSDPLIKHDIMLEIINAMIYQNDQSFFRLSVPMTNRLIASKIALESKGDV